MRVFGVRHIYPPTVSTRFKAPRRSSRNILRTCMSLLSSVFSSVDTRVDAVMVVSSRSSQSLFTNTLLSHPEPDPTVVFGYQVWSQHRLTNWSVLSQTNSSHLERGWKAAQPRQIQSCDPLRRLAKPRSCNHSPRKSIFVIGGNSEQLSRLLVRVIALWPA